MNNRAPSALPRPFRCLAQANLLAQLAEQTALAAVPIIAVAALAAGPLEIGVLAAAQTLPFLLLAIPFGLLADRCPRGRLMAAAESLRALTLIALLAAAAAEVLSLPLLGVLGFLGACGTVAFSVAAPALVPALVPGASLGRANGQIELARSLAYATGPALAGALVGGLGGRTAFAVAAALSLAALVLLRRLPPERVTPTRTRRTFAELRDGAALVWRHPLLRPVLLTAVVWNLSWFLLQAAYVPYAMQSLGLGARSVGATLACYGVGMVAGALMAPGLMQRLSAGQALLIGPVVSVLAAAMMVATLWWPTTALVALSFFCFGAGPLVWAVSSTTLRQTVTPPEMLGKVNAIFLTANAGARPLGAALGAGIAAGVGDQHAAAACLLLALGGFGMQALLIASSAVRSLRQLPTTAD